MPFGALTVATVDFGISVAQLQPSHRCMFASNQQTAFHRVFYWPAACPVEQRLSLYIQ
jgi:hypothetical protein